VGQAVKMLLMDDVREVFAMALRSLGYSGNDRDPKHIKKAYEKLRLLKPSVKVFNSDSPRQPFLNKWLATQGRTSSSHYTDIMKIEPRTARRHLNRFEELGLVRKTGSGPSIEYEVV
jgi:Fic family protein